MRRIVVVVVNGQKKKSPVGFLRDHQLARFARCPFSHGQYLLLRDGVVVLRSSGCPEVGPRNQAVFFPTQVVWFSSIFLFLGGGTRVFKSMVFTLVSD